MKDTCNNFVLLSIQITIVEFGLNKSSDTDFRTLPQILEHSPPLRPDFSKQGYVSLKT